jgi:hypothetical protein
MRLRARASKSARAKHVGSLRIMAQMPAILNVCSRYLALFCVFLQARKNGSGGKKTLNGHCLDPYQVVLEIILISSPIGYASIMYHAHRFPKRNECFQIAAPFFLMLSSM